MRFFFSFLCLIETSVSAFAGIGDWKSFTDMKNSTGVIGTPKGIWVGTLGGMYRFMPVDSTIDRFTNADGLTGNDISAIGKDSWDRIWIGHRSGAIDIYDPTDGSWSHIRDILQSSNVRKSIREFSSYGDSLFIATAYGISHFSLSKSEFRDTYSNFGSFTQDTVFSVAVSGGRIFAATVAGLVVSKIGATNLSAPDSWTTYATPNMPRCVVVHNGQVYAATANGLFLFTPAGWTPVAGVTDPCDIMVSAGQRLIVSLGSKVITLEANSSIKQLGSAFSDNITSLSVYSGEPVVGLAKSGFASYSSVTQDWTTMLPNGPASNTFTSVVVDNDGTVWAASGRAAGTGFYRYDNSGWTNYSIKNNPQLPSDYCFRITLGPNNSKWVSTYGSGIVVLNSSGKIVRKFDYWDPGFVGDAGSNVVPGGITTDRNGNVWVSIYRSRDYRVLWKMKADSTWTSFRSPQLDDYVYFWGLSTDQYGSVWFENTFHGFGLTPRFYFFNEERVIEGSFSDHWGLLTESDGLSTSTVNSIVLDKEGELWAGSNAGIVVISNPAKPKSSIKKIYLGAVRDQTINAIVVDALNNKWLATTQGIYVVSPDGTALLAQYSVESTSGKLLDNNVLSIAFDEKKGYAYFGTEKGLSRLEISTVALAEEFDKLTVSPNPFMLPDNSSITISGLVENSNIKIVSATGSLVKQFAAQGGGRAFWDGTFSDGTPASTGIYIVVAYAANGSQVATAKVAVIRR